MSLLQVKNLRVSIGPVQVCEDLTLHLKPGEVWSVLGRNGVGKTTLLHTLAGLRRPAAGTLLVDGTALTEMSARHRAKHISILFQHSQAASAATAGEIVMNGRHPWMSRWHGPTAKDQAIAANALMQVGLAGYEGRSFTRLSGGERRRVELASILAQQTQLVLLDEPVNHLDLRYQVRLLKETLDGWRQAGRAVVLVMHDLNLAIRFSDQLLCLLGGGKFLHGPVDTVATEENFASVFQHPLCEASAGGYKIFVPQ